MKIYSLLAFIFWLLISTLLCVSVVGAIMLVIISYYTDQGKLTWLEIGIKLVDNITK